MKAPTAYARSVKMTRTYPAPFAVLALLTACRSAEPTPAAPIDIAKTDAAPAAAPTATASAPLPSDSAAPTPKPSPQQEPPPGGLYTISIADRSNTCPKGDGGADTFASQPFLITPRPAKDGRFGANLPVNTGVGSPAIDRQDMLLAVGHTEKSSIRPDRTCAYEISRELEVREVSPTKIVVQIRAEYTEAVRCTLPRRPVSCKRDAIVTYSLAKALCPPRCITNGRMLGDGGVESTCTCLDGGL